MQLFAGGCAHLVMRMSRGCLGGGEERLCQLDLQRQVDLSAGFRSFSHGRKQSLSPSQPSYLLLCLFLSARSAAVVLTMLFPCRDHHCQDSLVRGRRLGTEVLMLLEKPPTKRFAFMELRSDTYGCPIATSLSWMLCSTLVLHTLAKGKAGTFTHPFSSLGNVFSCI